MTQIQEKAMLARVSVTQWSGRKHDRKVSQEVATNHGTSADVGRYNKVLLAKSALEKIAAAQGAVRAFHYKNTLPWKDDGARILASLNYFEYCKGMSGLRADFEREVAAFVANYAEYIEDSRVRLNGLFDENDYPRADQIARRFTFDFNFEKLPEAGDFRLDLSADEVERIRADIEARTNAAIADAVKDTWNRVHEVVAKMAERLRAYGVDENGKATGIFRDTLVSNVQDLVELLPRLNITGDAQLAATAARLDAELCAHDVKQLRDDEAVRAKVATDAESILEDMAGYFGFDAKLAA